MDVLSASGDNKIAWYANCVDFGDLPTAYNLTTLSDDGARHNIGDIYLGTQIDSETNGPDGQQQMAITGMEQMTKTA